MILTGKTRKGFYATAEYSEDRCIVKAGSKINMHPAPYLHNKGIVVQYRNDREYVDENGNVLKDCVFFSPSTAAMFVSGRSLNGLLFWYVAPKVSLRNYYEGGKK